MSEWYYVEDGERRGPIARDALMTKIDNGELAPTVLVWRDGMDDWSAADAMAEFSGPAVGLAAGAGAPAGSGSGGAYAGLESDGAGGYDPFTGEEYGIVPVTYAGFWKRFVAYIVDSIIVQSVMFVLQIGLAVLTSLPGFADSDAAIALVSVVFSLGSMVLVLVYFAAFESGNWQATPGKKVLGIKVTDLEGNRITFGRALGRNVAKILSGLILGIGYIMAGFTERKQALHDMIAGCLVING